MSISWVVPMFLMLNLFPMYYFLPKKRQILKYKEANLNIDYTRDFPLLSEFLLGFFIPEGGFFLSGEPRSPFILGWWIFL